MKNAQTSKQHLIAAINSLPIENALSVARGHLKHALNELEHIETKKARNASTQKAIALDWQKKIEENAKKGIGNPVDVSKALAHIEQMIATEKAKKIDPVKPTLDMLLN